VEDVEPRENIRASSYTTDIVKWTSLWSCSSCLCAKHLMNFHLVGIISSVEVRNDFETCPKGGRSGKEYRLHDASECGFW